MRKTDLCLGAAVALAISGPVMADDVLSARYLVLGETQGADGSLAILDLASIAPDGEMQSAIVISLKSKPESFPNDRYRRRDYVTWLFDCSTMAVKMKHMMMATGTGEPLTDFKPRADWAHPGRNSIIKAASDVVCGTKLAPHDAHVSADLMSLQDGYQQTLRQRFSDPDLSKNGTF